MMSLFRVFAILISLVIPTFVEGQTTWHGLQFGMSLSEVKEALSKSSSEVNPGGGTKAFNVSPSFDLDVPGAALPAHFRPALGISEKGLYVVTLMLDWGAYRNSTAPDSPALVISLLSQPVFEQLAIKYGQPITESGNCTEVSVTSLLQAGFSSGRSTPSCKAVWKGDKQTVTLSWVYTRNEDLTFFLVEYKPEIEGF
jgi:hypothetical protein